MLNQLRNAAKTWIAGVFIALLVMSFAVWGVSDIFTGGTRDAVVVVGKEQISVARVATAFNREVERLAEQSGSEFTPEMARTYGVDQAVLARLVYQTAMQLKTQELGLRASNDAIAAQLRDIDGFIDPITGRFDRDTYQQLLYRNGFTPAEFEASLRDDIVTGQLGAAMTTGVRAPDLLSKTRLMFARERRAISIVAIPPTAVGDIADPTPEEIAAFYAEREANFVAPARRSFTLVTLDVADFVRDTPVNEEDIQAAYEDRQDSLSSPELRDVVEMTAPDEAVAQDVARRLRVGEEPSAIAESLGLTAPNSYVGVEEDALLTPASGQAAFSVPAGEVSEPVNGGISWFVVRVSAVTPSRTPSYEEAHDELREDLASAGAGDMLFDAIDAFEDARNRGATLEAAARTAGLPAFSYDVVDASGVDRDGVYTALFLTSPEILEAVFEAPGVGGISDMQELGEEGFFVVRVDDIQVAAVRPLAEVEDIIRTQWITSQRNELFDVMANAAREALDAGQTPSVAAAAATMDARAELAELPRGQTVGGVTRQAAAQVFIVEQGQSIIAASADGGRTVVRVDTIIPAPELTQSELDDARALLSLELGNDLVEMFRTGLRNSYRVSPVDPRLLALATGARTDP